MAICLQNSLHLSWIKSVINSYGTCRNSWLLLTSPSPDASNPRQKSKNMRVTNLQTGKWWEQAEWSVIKFLSSHVKWSCCLLKARTQVPASGSFSVGLALPFYFPLFPGFEVHKLLLSSFESLGLFLSKVWSVSSHNGLLLVFLLVLMTTI